MAAHMPAEQPPCVVVRLATPADQMGILGELSDGIYVGHDYLYVSVFVWIVCMLYACR